MQSTWGSNGGSEGPWHWRFLKSRISDFATFDSQVFPLVNASSVATILASGWRPTIKNCSNKDVGSICCLWSCKIIHMNYFLKIKAWHKRYPKERKWNLHPLIELSEVCLEEHWQDITCRTDWWYLLLFNENMRGEKIQNIIWDGVCMFIEDKKHSSKGYKCKELGKGEDQLCKGCKQGKTCWNVGLQWAWIWLGPSGKVRNMAQYKQMDLFCYSHQSSRQYQKSLFTWNSD